MKKLLALLTIPLLIPFTNSAGVGAPTPDRKGLADHVVIVVWDGMRPDFITPEFTPNLHQLATEGVFFSRHHPVYISSTEVNGTAIATGAYPDRSGVIANRDYRPEMEWLDSMATESIEAIRRGDAMTGGHYLAVLTTAEILHESGIPTVVAGTKPVALLHDRSNRRTLPAALDSVMLYNGRTIPSSMLGTITQTLEKAFPPSATPNVARDEWTTKAMIQTLWAKKVPKFSLLWLSEPDASQHATSPGSDTSIAALQSSDKNLGLVLTALRDRKLRDKTDVFVVSDHGFSSIQRGVDVVEALRRANFRASRKFDDPEPGDVLVVGLGGSVLLYVMDHLDAVTHRLVQFFQSSNFAGVIFSRNPMEGTFPIEQVHLDTGKTSPDLIVALRWTADENEFGAPGLLVPDGGKKGSGTHASLSRFDMHNTLVANGPDFKRGYIDELPSGNADIAPTVLEILGIRPQTPMDGRILSEALRNQTEIPKVESQTVKASCDVGLRHWEQYLKFSKIGDAIYFDEGNGQSILK